MHVRIKGSSDFATDAKVVEKVRENPIRYHPTKIDFVTHFIML